MDAERVRQAEDNILTDLKYEDFGSGPVIKSRANREHSVVELNLGSLLRDYLRRNICEPMLEFKVKFKDGRFFIPDLAVVCDRSRIKKTYVDGAPDLVIEVMSLSTAKKDRGVKLRVYFENGAREVWLVSIEERSVYVHQNVEEFALYHLYDEEEAESFTEEERAVLVCDHVESRLFPDFKPLLEDIFEGTDW
jgi:Uma2 family endonuclease